MQIRFVKTNFESFLWMMLTISWCVGFTLSPFLTRVKNQWPMALLLLAVSPLIFLMQKCCMWYARKVEMKALEQAYGAVPEKRGEDVALRFTFASPVYGDKTTKYRQ